MGRARRGIKLFADGAALEQMVAAHRSGLVDGFTTNPTLMRKAEVPDYKAFAEAVLGEIRDVPVSFEVLADDLTEMAWQARRIASWGDNVYVKIPVSNTEGESTAGIIRDLAREGVQLNVTAVLTQEQVRMTVEALDERTPAIVSLFAGRIADTGRDPVSHMGQALALLRQRPWAELLWASPREILNLYQAEAIGCHIITLTPELLAKVALGGRALEAVSLDTVRMFRDDAVAAGYTL